MNWYAMTLDGQMKLREIIRKAEVRRQIAMADRHRSSIVPPRSQSVPASNSADIGPLQLFWRGLVGIGAR
jgi:hypothetical protein